MSVVRIVDLFTGMGGFRLGLMQGFKEVGLESQFVISSEIKKHAIEVLELNFSDINNVGDITKVNENDIPDFDILTAGFPCQSFSVAGNRMGFYDTRGTMFFEIERILKAKEPFGFILENVDGLVRHNAENKTDKIGRTLKTILDSLEEMGYYVSWYVLDSKDFGVPQQRKRIFIVGTKTNKIVLNDFKPMNKPLEEILEHNLPTLQTSFTKKLIKRYGLSNLIGKNIKDIRSNPHDIHSWNAEIFGPTTKEQKELLNLFIIHRRRKEYATELGIEPMEGTPLNIKQIRRFYNHPNLENMLEDLYNKGYLSKRKPKDLIKEEGEHGLKKYRKVVDNLEPGYTLIGGNFNFEITKILDPKKYAPTITTINANRLAVVDGKGLRHLTLREGLRLFGFPEDFKFIDNISKGYDLIGNTVVIPVIKYVATKLALEYKLFLQKTNY